MSSLWQGVEVAVLGGDARELYLIPELVKLGMEVKTAGLSIQEGLPGVKVCPNLEEAVRGVQAVLLPMPGIDNEGLIRAPLSPQPLRLTSRVMALIPIHAPIFVGVARAKLRELAQRRGHKIIELADLDEIAILNSIPSAEGALQMAMEELPITIHGSKSLVIGFGRTGMTLARMLAALGAKTYVVARSPRDLARIYELGYHSLTYAQLGDFIGEADIIFNTVPVPILTETLLMRANREVLIIDLASAPGGTDFQAAARLGIKALLAPGLPGKVAPKTAGLILARVIPELLARELSPQDTGTPSP